METNGTSARIDNGNKACAGELGEGRWNNYSHEEQISETNQMVAGPFIPYVRDKISVPNVTVPYQPGCQYSLVYPALINESLIGNNTPNGSHAYQVPYNNNCLYPNISQSYNTRFFGTKNPSASPLMQPSNIFMDTRNNQYVETGFMSNSRFLSAGIPSFTFSMNFPIIDPKDIFESIHTKNLEVVHDSLSARPKLEGQEMFSQSQNLADERFQCGESELILRKELTRSDVGSIGRIVLPKKDAEANLPPLYQSDGILICMDDTALPVTWKFKYRFWPNNKSRMYILENAGDFVKSHGLQAGDILSIHKSTVSANYFIKGEKKIRSSTTS